MSFNEGKDEGHPSQPKVPREIKDKFVCVIHSPLNNIMKQVNELNKYVEDLFRKLTKEIDRISFKLKALHENVIQLTVVITHKISNEVLSLQISKSRQTLSNVTIQMQQVCSSMSFPVTTFERNSTSVQIVHPVVPAFYHQDDIESLMTFSDISFLSCSYCSKLLRESIMSVSKDEKKEKLKQRKNLDHHTEPEYPQCQQMKDDISLGHIPDTSVKVSRSYLDQSPGSSFYIFPVNRNKNRQRNSIKNDLPIRLYQPLNLTEDVKTSHPFVIYGSGRREKVQFPNPNPIHFKSAVFVSPTAPIPPPLPPDWLSQLRNSKSSNRPESMHCPVKPSSPALKTVTTAALPERLQTTPDTALPKTKISSQSFETCKCCMLKPDYQRAEINDQRTPKPLSPPTISSYSQPWNSEMDVVDSALVVQPPRSSVSQYVKHSFAKSPRFSTANSSQVTSHPLKTRPAHGPQLQDLVLNKASPWTVPSSKSSKELQSSVPVLVSSCQEIPVSSYSLHRHSSSQMSRHIETKSSRSLLTNSAKYLHPPQSRLCLNSTKISILQSSASSTMSATSISSCRTSSISQYPTSLSCPNIKQSSLFPPIVTKARKALMEAIRKGVLLRKTKDQCVAKIKVQKPENDVDIIRIRRKAMGYSSGKSDSDVEWTEEK